MVHAILHYINKPTSRPPIFFCFHATAKISYVAFLVQKATYVQSLEMRIGLKA